MADENGFRKFCAAGKRVRKGLPEREIRRSISIAGEFEEFIARRKKPGFRDATKDDASAFMKILVTRKRNTWNNLAALLRYARFAGNSDVERAVLECLDGVDVLKALSGTIAMRLGAKKRDRIFRGVKLPKLGEPVKDWSKAASRFMNNLENELDSDTCKSILLTGPHAGRRKDYAYEREMFLDSSDVDVYLKNRHMDFVKTLETHMKDGTLFFNQKINGSVIEFVRKNQECGGGRRVGDIIYEIKIPYMAIEYIREKNPKLKRFYYCHCPWARSTILGGTKVSPTFCYCSAGFAKKPFEAAFGSPVKTEIVETVLAGGSVCRFAIRIPKRHLKKARKHK